MAYKQLRSSRTKRRRARRLGALFATVMAVGLVLVGLWSYKTAKRAVLVPKLTSTAAAKPAPKVTLAAAESGLLPWHLANPLSRLAVVPGAAANQLDLIGGLTSGDVSTAAITTLDTTSGSATTLGNLPGGVHDAASALVGGQMVLFGGGSTSSVDTVQAVSPSGTVTHLASLPQTRSDAEAVTVGGQTYVIGGYDGTTPDQQVLSTANGSSFTVVGALPVPVRYPAVAALNGLIYVFGGLKIGGSGAGNPVNTVQIIDTRSHKISVASWHLPVALSGASAVTLGGELFLAGGLSNVAKPVALGMGTTQLSSASVNASSDTVGTIWAVDTVAGRLLPAGQLQVPVANAGVAVLGSTAWLIGGETDGTVTASVQMIRPNLMFGTAGTAGAGSPYYGDKLLIADRGNNRLLVLDSTANITWRYPSSTAANPDFYFPDDAFFANHGTTIISNQEDNETVIQLAYPSGQITWSFGHPKTPGMAYGYLRAPDDAYLLQNNQVLVADDQNCRVLFINPDKTIAHQIGTNGVCKHSPPTSLGSPNGNTPLQDGNVLISEIFGSWVSEYTPEGKLVWTTHLPISYPSDPQQLGAAPGQNPDNYLIADYSSPGAVVRFNRAGNVLYKYSPTSGTGRLDHPSLVEQLPSGVYMLNDDRRNRMVAIDPVTNALVWQYGVTDTTGTQPGMLNRPDGFDVLQADGTTPTHNVTR